MNPIDVGILGATGMVGQQFIALLAKHPWFRVQWVGASQRSEGKDYRDACAWRLPVPLPDRTAALRVDAAVPDRAPQLVFSGLDSSVAGEIEQAFAESGRIIVSNTRNYRMVKTVPLLIPEVNADHLGLLDAQGTAQGWPGRIVTNPNCAVIVLAMALAPLRQFGLSKATITTLQAISGAGYPGVASLDITDNVIPFIPHEEEKIERETRKILGRLDGGGVTPAAFAVSAQCHRVNVVDGHVAAVRVRLVRPAEPAELGAAFAAFSGAPQALRLPSAPARPILVREEPDRPQPRLDRDAGRGMSVTVGRVARDAVLGHRFLVLGHNTIRGAAGAAILNAELMVAQGYLEARR